MVSRGDESALIAAAELASLTQHTSLTQLVLLCAQQCQRQRQWEKALEWLRRAESSTAIPYLFLLAVDMMLERLLRGAVSDTEKLKGREEVSEPGIL